MYLPFTGPHYKKVNNDRIAAGFTESYYVQSKTHPAITSLEGIWYKDRKKRLPIDQLYDYLTPLSLAWWYQDDGHLKTSGNTLQKIIFSTESFTPLENQLLCKILKEKFCLQFSIDKQGRIIIYDQFQIHCFLHLVSPYIHPCMIRKMKSSCTLPLSTKSKRTTIYLPEEISLKSPTLEINNALSYLKELWEMYRGNNFYRKELIEKVGDIKEKRTKPYQIVVHQHNVLLLDSLKNETGLNYSMLASLCVLQG